MPNIIPVPIFTSNYYYISYDNNPLTKIKTVNLDISPSQPGTGYVITGYNTIIAWQPPGQAAFVSASSSQFPIINNIDASIPGTLVILAIVRDSNPDTTKDTSYDAIFPRQNGPTSKFGRGPYSGVGPVPSQICYIVVQTPNGLSKPGKYHRDWMDMPGSYGDLVDHVDTLLTNTGPLTNGIGKFDHLYEYTPGHNIWVHNNLEIQNTAQIRLDIAANPSQYNVINGAYDAFDPSASLNVQSATNYDLVLSRPSTVPGESVRLRVGPGHVSVATPGKARSELRVDDINPNGPNRAVHISGAGVHNYDLGTDIIAPETNNTGVIISGRGTHSYDLGTDIISPETDNTGVTVRGRGTHFYDLFVDNIRADTPGAAVWAIGNASPNIDLMSLRIGTSVITELLPPLGVLVDDVFNRNGKVASYVGGATANRRPHVHVLASQFVGAASTGGGVAGTPEVGLAAVVPADALTSCLIAAKAVYTLVGAGNKRIVVSFGGTIIHDFTTAVNTTLFVHVFIARTGASQQRCIVQHVGGGVAVSTTVSNTTIDETSAQQVIFAFRSVNPGTVILQCAQVTSGDSIVAYP